MFNAVGARDPTEQKWSHKAFQVQQAYWGKDADVTEDEEKDWVQMLREDLQSKRDKINANLVTATTHAHRFDLECEAADLAEDFSTCAMSISVECTNDMIAVAEKIMAHCISIIKQKPPCSFDVVAIGSLARGEATPYSDLEYLFLLAPGSKTPQTVTYFEKLALTTYFIIGNLRETKLSYMAIDELLGQNKWFVDKSKNGFKIDGLAPQAGNIPTGNGAPKTRIDEEPSGNIPTGNGDPLTKNHFITTPDSLAKRYEAILQNPVREDALMGDLTAMLAYMKTVYSYKHPQDQDSPDILLHLKELIAAMEPSEKRRAINKEMLRNDMEKFNFKPDRNLFDTGATVDVKKDLYRFPSLLVYDLSIVFDCVGNSIWETIDLLHKRKHISKEIKSSILFQLACACYVRLSTYLHHDSHDDRVSLLEGFSITQTSTTGVVKGDMARWHIPGGLLFAMCDHLIPLKGEIQNHHGDLDTVLMSERVRSDWWCAVQAMFYCGWNQKAFEFLCSEFGSESHLLTGPDQLCREFNLNLTSEMCDLIGDVLHRIGHRVEAGKYYKAKTDGQTMMQGLKVLSLGASMTPQEGIAAESVIPSQTDGLRFLKIFGFDLQDFYSWMATVTNEQSLGTPVVPALLEVFNMVMKFAHIFARHSRGMEDEIERKLEESGIRDSKLYETYFQKCEVLAMCLMWNGDLIDEMLGNAVSSHSKRREPSKIKSIHEARDQSADLPATESKAVRYMRLELSDRVDSFDSDSMTTWLVMVSFGIWYASIEQYDAAKAYIEKAESLLAKKFGENAAISQNIAVLGAKAINLSLQGRKVESSDFENKCLLLCHKLYGSRSGMIEPLTDMMQWVKKLDRGDNLGSRSDFLQSQHIDVISTVMWDWISSVVVQTEGREDDLD